MSFVTTAITKTGIPDFVFFWPIAVVTGWMVRCHLLLRVVLGKQGRKRGQVLRHWPAQLLAYMQLFCFCFYFLPFPPHLRQMACRILVWYYIITV